MKNIPVISVQALSLAEAYEKALVGLYEQGCRFKTQYDKPEDPESIDATMNITILDPMADPMIHKAFPGGIEDLKEYVMELKGIKDHWVKNMNDEKDTRWEYTYHGRLAAYGIWKDLVNGESVEVGNGFKFNQIESVIDKLCKQPFTRQAQMITWMPNLDNKVFDPPCLQSLWYRILEDEDGVQWLNSNIRFRSNDAFGANFMNMFGFTYFNAEIIAAGITEKTGKDVRLGRMNWQADSFHIYGKDIAKAKQLFFDRLDTTTFEDRVYNMQDEMIKEMYDEAEEMVIKKIEMQDRE